MTSTAHDATWLEQQWLELDAIETELCKQELHTFVKCAWHIIEPDQEFVDNWHIRLLCSDLEAITRGDVTREIINIPPGTMKSILMVLWFAWMWASNASLKFFRASYSDHLSIRDNIKLRSIILSPWYQERFSVKLVDDQNMKKLFKTTDKGESVATSVGGAGTGEHPDFIVIDDPLTAIEAYSEVERGNVNSWMGNTISSRGVARNVRVVLVMQRLHENDLSGFLLEKGGWKHRCLPMRYEETTPDPRTPGAFLHVADPDDPRTKPGELLWPAVFTEEKVKTLETDLGSYDAAGQLQQRPAPEGGGMFKREWFKILDVAPTNVLRRTRFWDTAGTENDGDWTAGARLAYTADKHIIIEDMQHGQWSPASINSIMLQTARVDGFAVAIREEEEGGGSGKAAIAQHVQLLGGYNYKGIRSTGAKQIRWKPLAAQAEAGNVYLVAGPWNKKFLDEITMVPGAKHDDQTDAAASAFLDLTGIMPLQQVRMKGF